MSRKSANVKATGSVPTSTKRVSTGGHLNTGLPRMPKSAGKSNPMGTIKGKSAGKNGGTAC